ncbi:MAG: trehalose operon repressor [Culicoidibacterales bacterium]
MNNNKYYDIYLEIKNDIRSGKYLPEHKLPSENVLREIYQVSRNTIRRSLAQLIQEGFVTSVHGKGVFVLAKPPLHFLVDDLQSFSEVSVQTQSVETEIPLFESLEIDQQLAEKTGFDIGTRVNHIIRVRIIDGIKIIVDDNYFDTSLISDLTPTIAAHSIYDYIEHVLMLKIHGAKKTIAIEPASAIDQEYLEVDQKQLIATIKNTVYLASGRQFEYTESRHLPERFLFHTFARR